MKALLLFILVLLSACQQTAPPNATPDPYSEQCAANEFGLADGTCRELTACASDEDCSYLLMEQTFPRYGRCVEGICKAYCGSGIERECTRQ